MALFVLDAQDAESARQAAEIRRKNAAAGNKTW
jgi:hypothetical protein